jgi:hypothetical protein
MFEIIPAEISGIDFSQLGGFSAEPGRAKAGWLARLCNWLVNLAIQRDPAAVNGITVLVELRERFYEQTVERDRLARTLTTTLAAAEQAQAELHLLRAALGVAQRRYTDLLARREEALGDTLLACVEATAELDRIREGFQRTQPEAAAAVVFSTDRGIENRDIGLRG